MKLHTRTDQVVSDLVSSLLPEDSTLRQQHVLREALNSLVRLAKSEQMVEVRTNVRRLTGTLTESAARNRSRVSGSAANGFGQQQFEFIKPE